MQPSFSSRARQFSGFSAIFRLAALVTFASMVTTGAAVFALASSGGQQKIADPFAAYADLLPGQAVSLTALVAEGFTCVPDTRPTPADLAEVCANAGRSVQVVASTISIRDGVVARLDLNLRGSAFSIGDLALLWGTPEIQQAGHSVSLRWRARHITATSSADSGRFSYFQPVLHVSLEQ